jgi:hypothetical protein
MRAATIIRLAVLAGALAIGSDAADEMAALRALIGEIKVSIRHTAERTEAKEGRPPLQSESWVFTAGGVNPTVHYGRYLNQPPDYTGNFPSLPNGDLGIGLDGGPFHYWYAGNTLRVLLDGRDVFAEQPAQHSETKEGADGHLRLIWELAQQRRVVLHVVVPRDGRAVFAGLDIEPGAVALKQLEVRLLAYPGGFGPAYGMPSHRYAKAASAGAEVPPGFKASPDTPHPVLTLAAGDDWIFYGDKRCSSGALGLLLNRAEQPAGRVSLSNYGVTTILTYPAATRQLRLGFFAYSLENDAAETTFRNALDSERQALRNLPGWP